jgi:hypothetical protein
MMMRTSAIVEALPARLQSRPRLTPPMTNVWAPPSTEAPRRLTGAAMLLSS